MTDSDVRDCFISHASEDKDAVARPLAEALINEGYGVWFDEFELEIGDSLREKIDDGLAKSRFGVVVLSESFFAKNWPKAELDGLMARQMIGEEKIILPVWHGIDEDYLEGVSPTLASLVGLPSDPLDKAVEKIAKKIDRRKDVGSTGAALVSAQASNPAPPYSDLELMLEGGRGSHRLKLEYDNGERMAFEAQGGSGDGPGWFSVLLAPAKLQPDLIVAPNISVEQLRDLVINEQWYPDALLNRQYLRADLDGFYSRLPESAEDGPPAFWLRIWQDGLMEFGETIAHFPADDRRLPYITLAQWAHDYVLLFAKVLKEVGYDGEVVAKVVLGNVRGFGIGLPPGAYFSEYRPIEVERVESRPLRAAVDDVPDALNRWLKATMDRVFLATGISTGAFFIDENGMTEQ